MSLHFAGKGDIARDPSAILVNTVNTVGVMGKGVALAMKNRFPELMDPYLRACESGNLVPGTIHIGKTEDGRRVVNMATKKHWRDDSRLEWVGSGLMYLNLWMERQDELPASLALPMPGAGNGGLDPARVQQMVRTYLAPIINRGVEVTLFADEEPILQDEIYFAGVGARKTPKEVLHLMSEVAALAGNEAWVLRSGGAVGADTAFHNGALRSAGSSEIYLPRANPKLPEGIVDIRDVHYRTVANFHPAGKNLSGFIKELMARNACQVFGVDFSVPSSVVVCWTEGGRGGGGTGQAIRMARAADIPVVDLGAPEYRGITASGLMDVMREEAEGFHARRGLEMPDPEGRSNLERMGL